jgi:hypothetical protein
MNLNLSLIARRTGVLLLIAAGGCSQQGPAPVSGQAGSQGSAGAGTQGAAGQGAAGTVGAAGVAGTGAAGTAGSGAAGTGTAGSTGEAGAGAAGTGGSAGATGAAGSGGAAGAAAGATGAGGAIAVDSVVPTLNGYLWIGLCANGAASALDCPLNDDISGGTCPMPNAADYNMRGAFRNFTHNVGGTAGTKYTITFEVRGVAGTRCYTCGTPAVPALSPDPEVNNNGWYVGGTPTTDSHWNSYEIHVNPPVPGAANVYYMNAFPNGPFCEKHETFPFKYTASFPVMGGGTLKMTIHDSNCLAQQNCGAPNNQPTCKSPRTIDLTGMSPQPPAPFAQPYVQTNAFHPQWLFFNVKSVTSP